MRKKTFLSAHDFKPGLSVSFLSEKVKEQYFNNKLVKRFVNLGSNSLEIETLMYIRKVLLGKEHSHLQYFSFFSGIQQEEMIKSIDSLTFLTMVTEICEQSLNRIGLKSNNIGLFKFTNKKDVEILIMLPVIPRLFKKKVTMLKRAKKGFVFNTKGNEIPIQKAIKIKGNWYEKEVEIALIDGKWEIITSDHFQDYRTNIWYRRDSCDYFDDFISVDDNGVTNVVLKTTLRKPTDIIRSVIVLRSDGRIESYNASNWESLVSSGKFIDLLPEKDVIVHKAIPESIYNTFESLRQQHWDQFNHIKPNYLINSNFSDELKSYLRNLNNKNGVSSITNLVSENKPYSFGIELETSAGKIPRHTHRMFNWKAVRDGSVQGAEYVTGVLFGDAGFTHLSNICSVLSKYTKVDKSCGVHVHIGNCSFSKEFNIFMTIIGYLLEKELFSMMPASRAGNTFCSPISLNWLNKNELYALLSNNIEKDTIKSVVDSLYNRLYSYLYDNSVTSDSDSKLLRLGKNRNRSSKHPGGHYGNGHGTARYNWLNLLNSNFVQRSENLDMICKDNEIAKKATIADFEQDKIPFKPTFSHSNKVRLQELSSDPSRAASFSGLRNLVRRFISIDFPIPASVLSRSSYLANIISNSSVLSAMYENMQSEQGVYIPSRFYTFARALRTHIRSIEQAGHLDYSNFYQTFSDLISHQLREDLTNSFGNSPACETPRANVNKSKVVKEDFKSVYTVEFRIHSGTTNYIKIRNWLLICMAIIFFVEERRSKLIEVLKQDKPSLTLETVLKEAYSEKLAIMLTNYVNKRKEMFAKHNNEGVIPETTKRDKSSLLETIKDLKTECV